MTDVSGMERDMDRERIYTQYMYSYPHKTAYRKLENVRLTDWMSALCGKENSLYAHIPFCQYKCGYCNLFSVTGRTEEYMEQYMDALERQAAQLSSVLPEDVTFADLTLGGGTPLILSERLLERLFRILEKYFAIPGENTPVIVETSPNQTTPEKLEILKAHGCSRISIGVQSFIEEELRRLHRFHSPDAVCQALTHIRQIGFPIVNIDIIYGIAGQTRESLLVSLDHALEFSPEEMFVYPLYIKPGTALYREGIVSRTGEEEQYMRRLYETARDFLTGKGYRQDSMRRFVRKKEGKSGGEKRGEEITGKKDTKRKDVSCGFSNTISLGCGGRSYVGNLHFCTPYALGQEGCLKKLSGYMETKDFLRVEHGYILSEEEQKRRYVIKHILFGNGIRREEYRAHFGGEAERDFPELQVWEKMEYAEFTDTHIQLTVEGLARSDELGPQLISSAVRQRMETWQ